MLLVVPYLKRPVPIESRFPTADGVSVRAETIDLSHLIKVNLRYSLISDDGVELELITDGKRVWADFAEPLGAEHSWYEQTVKCALVDGHIVLHSNGTYGDFTEYRRLTNGYLIKRETRPKRPEPVAIRPTPSKDEIQERMDWFREQADRAEPYSAPKDGMRGFTSEQPPVPPR